MGVAIVLLTVIGREVESRPSLGYTGKEDCSEIPGLVPGYAFISGPYYIQFGSANKLVQVCCDFTTGGAWTVIQRRIDGSTGFNRSWTEYCRGFGDSSMEHWIGLDSLHLMTSSKRYILRIELTDCDEVTKYAEYDNFVVGREGCKYTLVSVGEYCGDAGDSLTSQVRSKFTTFDQNNAVNCSSLAHSGGWWYKDCQTSNLNGQYQTPCGNTTLNDGITWETGKGYYYSYKHAVMKIRPFD